ncbi:membrane protein insertion efficiency factor YidD [Zavarzinella formosa]|uniref:membrane protein insertion efficiency factor YidD n=1 Tax=Zavarzinella formosa TaxID=360055 RepID=UPI0002F12E5D|nr:membrane protein insertion efficiency factor YidD [Zavarzinella formosa]
MKAKNVLVLPLWPVDRGLALIACLGVIAYRRWISPHKGFTCAYGTLTHEPSCSTVALQAFRTQIFSQAMPAVRRQLTKCRETYNHFVSEQLNAANNQSFPHASSTNETALGCGPCEANPPLKKDDGKPPSEPQKTQDR